MRIETEDLHFTYPGDVQALQGISLTIEPGQQVVIVGQNGAGKTTLVKHFNGLVKPTQGRVHIGDWDTRQHTIARLARRVGYVFQNPDDQLFSRTVAAEVAVGPRNLDYAPERIEALVQDALELTDLVAEAHKNPYDLPSTQRKLVAMASVLAMDTPIVVLDEPTMGQDAAAVERIGRIVARLAEQGKTVIAITHDVDFAAGHFDRLIALRRGRVLLDGPLRDVITRADELATTAVEPPQITRLGLRLELPEPVIGVDDFLQAYRRRLEEKD